MNFFFPAVFVYDYANGYTVQDSGTIHLCRVAGGLVAVTLLSEFRCV